MSHRHEVVGHEVVEPSPAIAQDARAVLRTTLQRIVGADHVLTDPDVTVSYETDWTGRRYSAATAVVRPGSTDEVSAVIAACAGAGVPVIPQGGNTGLVGASVPRAGEVVLSTRRLQRLDPVDLTALQVTVGAGVTLSRLQEHVRAAGLEVGVDFGARDSATIGGILATNAGGERVVRYGMVRAQIVGLEAVLPDGRVVSRLGGLVKDNSGYDLTGLVVGSEGTLAVITAARLRLFPRAPATATALLSLDDVAAAVSAVGALRARAPGLLAAELFLQSGLDLVCTQLGMAPPSLEPAPVYLLVECGGDASIDETLATAIAGLDGVRDAVVAPNEDMRRRLWEYRESHPLAINAVGPPLKLDVAVPLRSFAAYVEGVAERLATIAPDARLVLFGHLAEGNLHVNIVGLADEQFDAVADDLLHQVRDYAGSISAEHGVGVLKARWLHLGRTAEEIETMVAIKRALDPHGVLSPHTLFAGEC